MSKGLKQIFKQSLIYTTVIVVFGAILIALFWPSVSRMNALLGLFWGALIALCGFSLICHMVSNLSQSIQEGKKKGRSGYFLRYAFYAVSLALGAWLRFSLITMLLGVVAQKASLVLYTLINERIKDE